MKTRQTMNKFFGMLAILALMLTFSYASAQMKTPSRYDSKAGATKDTKANAKEDDYYNEEQAGGGSFKEEVQVLDKSTIMSVVKKRATSVQYCYEKELQTQRKLQGRLLVNFTILLNGKVKNVKVVKKKSSMKDKAVVACVVDIMKSLRFPARKTGETIEINWPWSFKAKK